MEPMPEWKRMMESSRLKSLSDLFGVPKPVVGMVRLWPLPLGRRVTGATACRQSWTTRCATPKRW
jgi:hypothetical protein